MTTEERITVARLDGLARRLDRERLDRTEAVDALREVSTDPHLLADVGGSALGSWRHDRVKGLGGDWVAELMLAAGADPEHLENVAVATEARLRLIGQRPSGT